MSAKKTTKPVEPVEVDETEVVETSRPINSFENKFVFEWDGLKFELPFVEHIPMGILEDCAGADKTAAQAWDEIVKRLSAESDQEEVRRALPLSVYGDMLAAWDEASGIKLGELYG